MAFQDNSGDIIFDVVLTDEGRRRLARGDGSFNIVKFALGDDEINYELYDTTAATQNQDIQILQTPIFEAFTNNTSTMSSMLMSIPRNNLLYLPILKVNEVSDGTSTKFHTNNVFNVAVDANTENNNGLSSGTTALAYDSDGKIREGFMLGFSTQKASNYIRIDAGIDNSAVPPATNIADLFLDETQYSIEIDNRLGSIISRDGATRISPSSIDDDNIALYVLSAETDPNFVFTNTNTESGTGTGQVIEGARSTYLEFRIASSINLRQSDFLFNRLGSTSATSLRNNAGSLQNHKFIDSLVKITGLNTGYSIDLPIRFVKL
tara:strand:+ start:436 stop:1398 length:963 start_codon:yes stop_codon:yes gene_type:complete